MSNPRIEEVEDSDPEIEDPEEFLPNEIFRPANQPQKAQTAISKPQPQSQPANPTLFRPPEQPSEADIRRKREEIKPYNTIYPCYFSASRSRAQGRRVGKSLASRNPLAFNVFKAVRSILGNSIYIAFEPDKTHPKDWANPGRVKVQLFDKETHEALHPKIQNKQYLYTLVAQHLKDNPTRPEDPLEMKMGGLPIPENFLDTKVEAPRGWKMQEILPVHSAAVSGGGVSENFFKDAMEEMKQAQAAGQLGGGAGGGGPDMSGLASMMQNMGGMGGMLPGMGGGGGGSGRSESPAGKKKKDKKKG